MPNDKYWLERRLRREVLFLKPDLRDLFRRGRFTFSAKRITSVCGTYALQWENHANTQNRRGRVSLVTIDQGERTACA